MKIEEIIKVFDLFIENAETKELKELIKDIKEMYEEKEKLNDIIIELETERDVLKSKLSETKADIKYLLEYGEGNGYIRSKYLRGDKE